MLLWKWIMEQFSPKVPLSLSEVQDIVFEMKIGETRSFHVERLPNNHELNKFTLWIALNKGNVTINKYSWRKRLKISLF